MLEHGGRMLAAARIYGIPPDNWLDLSTGVNPSNWPIPDLPPTCWQRLPEEEDGLVAAAAQYYGNASVLPVAGSQAALQVLPGLFPPGRLACNSPTYAEHPAAWQRAGHTICPVPCGDPAAVLATDAPYVLVCNPNNPTADRWSRTDLLALAARQADCGGWLIVDEAFMDATPEDSVTPWAGTETAPNLITLRSLGKFFGLAGARVGFLFGAATVLERVAEQLGPWTVSGPARLVARLALQDTAWQTETRQSLIPSATRLLALVSVLGKAQATPLFATVSTPESGRIYEDMAHQGILIRHFPQWSWLRFGLPGGEMDWERLETALRFCVTRS